jgi:hypothetical protein
MKKMLVFFFVLICSFLFFSVLFMFLSFLSCFLGFLLLRHRAGPPARHRPSFGQLDAPASVRRYSCRGDINRSLEERKTHLGKNDGFSGFSGLSWKFHRQAKISRRDV